MASPPAQGRDSTGEGEFLTTIQAKLPIRAPSALIPRLYNDEHVYRSSPIETITTEAILHTTAPSLLPNAVTSEPMPLSIMSIGLDEPRWTPRSQHRYRGWRLRLKRALDLAAASVLVAVLWPVMVATALVIRSTSRGPAIFRQRRVGRGGELFTVYKFRTMHPNADVRLQEDPVLYALYRDGGFKIALDEDPRVTAMGRFLRKSSMDELPQLFNVLRGDMSLVGPRPVVPDELAEYGDLVDAYLMAIPGLTGAWQVSGRDEIKFPERAHLDANYIDGWSLRRDARIALLTIPATLAARGVE